MPRALLVMVIVATALTSAVSLAGEPIWQMMMHDCRHSCQSSFNGPSRANIAWSTPLGGIANSPLTVSEDGTIYAVFTDYGTWSTSLWALTPGGDLKWSYDADLSVRNCAAIADDGTVYLLVPRGLYAFSPEGNIKWRQRRAAHHWSSPTIGPGGTIYAVNGFSVCSVNPDGTLNWESTIQEMLELPPLVAPNGNIYAIAWMRSTNQAKLFALDGAGKELWDYYVDGWDVCSLCVAQDSSVKFYSVAESALFSIEADGQLSWTFDTGPAGPLGSTDVLLGIGDDETIYLIVGKPEKEPGVPIYESTLFALTNKGQVKWSREIEGLPPMRWAGLAIAADGTLYVGVEDVGLAEVLYALDSDGNEKWRFQHDGASSPVIGGNGVIYLSHWNVSAIAEFGTIQINLLLDQTWYYTGDVLSLAVAGENMAPSTNVDLYLVMWDIDGNIYSWPTWQPGVHPGMRDVHIPYGTRWMLENFVELTLPAESPPINQQARYWFAVALTGPGTRDFLCDPEVRRINFVANWVP